MNSRMRQVLEEMRRQRELQKLRQQQKEYNLDKNISTAGKVASNLPKAIDYGKKAIGAIQGLKTPTASPTALTNSIKAATSANGLTSGLGNTSALTDSIKTATAVKDAANTANTISNAANTAKTASDVANAANTASTVGNAASTASSAANAAPVVGSVLGGLSAANNFAKGNHVDGALDVAKTGAAFIPGVGWAIAGAIQIGQMIKNAINKKKQKSIQKNMEAMAKNEQLANEKKQDAISELEQNSQAINTMPQQSMSDGSTSPTNVLSEQIAQATQPTGLNEDYIGSDGSTDIMAGYQPTEAVEPAEESKPSWGQNILDAIGEAKGLGASQEALDAIPQGLNLGNKDIAALIDKYRVNKPATPEEVELAKAGEFNKPVEQTVEETTTESSEPSRKEQIISGMMDKIRGGLNNFSEGYKDNAYTSFSEGDLAKGIMTGAAANAEPKTFMNRLGEAVGTGSRVISNPGFQGLVAGAIKGANTGDWGTGLEYGVNWAANKAKSDNYYKRINPDAERTPIFSNYDADDFKAYADYAYKSARTDSQAPTADWYYKQELANGRLAPEQYKAITTAPDYDPLMRVNLKQEQVNTKAANDARKIDVYEKNIQNLISNRDGKLQLDREKFNALKATYGPKIAKDLAYVKYLESGGKYKDALTALLNEADSEGTGTEDVLDHVTLPEITPELAQQIKDFRKNRK